MIGHARAGSFDYRADTAPMKTVTRFVVPTLLRMEGCTVTQVPVRHAAAPLT